jgi:CheY-like chemotaxis protein
LAIQKGANITLAQPVLIQDLAYSLLHEAKPNLELEEVEKKVTTTKLALGQSSTLLTNLQTSETSSTQVGSSNNNPIINNASKQNLQVLIVDDNAINREIVCSMLRKMGCEPIVAKDGLEAVEISKNEVHDIILMDVQMPGMDGLEASRTIRQREQNLNLKRKPIIALTANAMTDDKENCIKAGMDDYLTKPFTRVQLTELMSRWTKVLTQ